MSKGQKLNGVIDHQADRLLALIPFNKNQLHYGEFITIPIAFSVCRWYNI